MRDIRGVIARPEWGVLRQGVLFSGAAADGYDGCAVAGLIITAHCDLAHDKVPVVNFVPVVHAGDWLLRDYAALLSRRLRADSKASITDILKQANLSEALLETESIETVLAVIQEQGGLPAKVKERAKSLCEAVTLCDSVLQTDVIDEVTAGKLTAVNPKTHRRALSELMDESLGGYYFLPNVEPDVEHIGFVALFRQVYHLPRRIAALIAGGATGEELATIMKDQPNLAARVATEHSTFAMPVGQVTSPFLEHLMQQFGLLYTRIGVTDLAPSFVTSFAEKAAGGFIE